METFRSVYKLKPFVRPFLWLIVISGVLAIPLAALRFSPAPLVKYFVDDLLVDRDKTKLFLFPALLIALAFANFVNPFFFITIA